jgi:hypothetical protein
MNKQGTHFLYKKWVRIAMLILGGVLTLMALTEIYCIVFKPKDYELIINVLGNKYYQQLFLGILLLVSYWLLQKSKPTI